ncbi:MAG: glycoside hydrolase domain-containing protein [Bacteroides cellulosilyticus]
MLVRQEETILKGNAWQYTWHVGDDVEELINRVGGNEAFVTKLDSLFFLDHTAEVKGFVGDVTGLIGQYSQGNEPSHHHYIFISACW